jgi:RNA polymerase primary sigma factor
MAIDVGPVSPSDRTLDGGHSWNESLPDEETSGTSPATRSPGDSDGGAMPSGLTLFLNAVGRYRLLTAADEIELAKKVERGDRAARERMITSNLRLVVAIAKSYRLPESSPLSLLDLVQEGVIGLTRAVELYDWRRGNRFSTYASYWIRQSMTRSLQRSRTIRVPARVHGQLRLSAKAERELRSRLGREPLEREVAQSVGLSTEELADLRRRCSTVSLDDTDSDSFSPVAASISAEGDVFEDVYERLSSETVRRAVASLPARLRQVVVLRFGLAGEEPHSLAEIGQRFGVTRERVRQLEQKALKELTAHGAIPSQRGTLTRSLRDRVSAFDPGTVIGAFKAALAAGTSSNLATGVAVITAAGAVAPVALHWHQLELPDLLRKSVPDAEVVARHVGAAEAGVPSPPRRTRIELSPETHTGRASPARAAPSRVRVWLEPSAHATQPKVEVPEPSPTAIPTEPASEALAPPPLAAPAPEAIQGEESRPSILGTSPAVQHGQAPEAPADDTSAKEVPAPEASIVEAVPEAAPPAAGDEPPAAGAIAAPASAECGATDSTQAETTTPPAGGESPPPEQAESTQPPQGSADAVAAPEASPSTPEPVAQATPSEPAGDAPLPAEPAVAGASGETDAGRPTAGCEPAQSDETPSEAAPVPPADGDTGQSAPQPDTPAAEAGGDVVLEPTSAAGGTGMLEEPLSAAAAVSEALV